MNRDIDIFIFCGDVRVSWIPWALQLDDMRDFLLWMMCWKMALRLEGWNSLSSTKDLPFLGSHFFGFPFKIIPFLVLLFLGTPLAFWIITFLVCTCFWVLLGIKIGFKYNVLYTGYRNKHWSQFFNQILI